MVHAACWLRRACPLSRGTRRRRRRRLALGHGGLEPGAPPPERLTHVRRAVAARTRARRAESTAAATPAERTAFVERQRAALAAEKRLASGDETAQASRAARLEVALGGAPLALGDVAVVLVSPKSASNLGAAARSAAAFELGVLRLVTPRCGHLSRRARQSANGSEGVLEAAEVCSSLEEALEGTAAAIAFARFSDGGKNAKSDGGGGEAACRTLVDAAASEGQGVLVDLLAQPTAPSAATPRIALVFGREDSGLTAEELGACTAVVSVPMGRLAESLSLPHCVTLALGQLYEMRTRPK